MLSIKPEFNQIGPIQNKVTLTLIAGISNRTLFFLYELVFATQSAQFLNLLRICELFQLLLLLLSLFSASVSHHFSGMFKLRLRLSGEHLLFNTGLLDPHFGGL